MTASVWFKKFLLRIVGNYSRGDVRKPTIIERRGTCPLCIGYADKVEDPEMRGPTKEERISRRRYN